MHIKHLLLATIAAVLLGGVAHAADYGKDQLPKKPYDPQRQIGLDKPWEIGSPGKTKYDPKEKSNRTSKYNTSKYNTSKYGAAKSSNYAKANKTSKDNGKYAPIEKETVLKYNKMVVESNKRLKTAGKLYGAALKPIFFDEEADLDQVREAQDYLAARVDTIYKVMKAYHVPDTKGAAELNKAHMAFLDYQKKMVKEPLNKVMGFLEDPNLKPEDKKAEIEKLLNDMRKEEVQHYLALKSAQEAYAEAHGIEIVRETIADTDQGKQAVKQGQMKKRYSKKGS